MPSAFRFLTVFTLGGVAAWAQSSPVQPLPPRQRPVNAAATAPVRSETAFNPDDPIYEPIYLPGTEAREVAKVYERLSGKRVIIDTQALGQVNVDVKPPLTRAEALRIIEVSYMMNGFHLIHMEDGTVKLLGQNRNPRGFGVPIISDELQLPEGERIVTYIFKLKYADPQEVATVLQSYVGAGGASAAQLTALPKSQALVLTENSLVIRRILQLMKEIDVPPAEVVSEFIALQRANPKDILEKLEKIFERNQQAQQTATGATTAGVNRPAAQTTVAPGGTVIPPEASAQSTGPNSVEISGGSLSEDSIIIGKIKLTVDERTNRLHVVTRPINLSFIRQLVSEFDADVPFGEPTARPLRFVSAADIFGTVVDAIKEQGQKVEGGSGGSGRGGSSDNNSSLGGGNGNNNLLGNNNSLGGSNDSYNNGGFGGTSGSGGGGLTFSESLNTKSRESTPEARIIGNTKIIADNRNNTIIVLGNQEVKNKIFKIIDELDVRAPQVMLHTVIGELNLTSNRRLGVNYVANRGSNRGLFGNGTTTGNNGNNNGNNGDGTGTGSSASANSVLSLSGGNPVLNLSSLIGNNNISQILTAGSGGFSGFVAAGNSFAALIDALEASDRFKVVSRPSIFTTNNKKATIASGEEIAVPVNITGGFTGGNVNGSGLVTQSSIQYKSVLLQLEVLPLINSEREVTLDIVQKVNQQSGSDIIDNNSIPRIATRALQTTVSMRNEETLVLGGLIKQTNSKGVSGVPYLSKIPGLGALFRRTTSDKTRTELVILIRPTVTMAPREQTRVRERAMETLNVETDLEATLYPPHLRRKTSAEEMTRRSPLRLREEGEVPVGAGDRTRTERELSNP